MSTTDALRWQRIQTLLDAVLPLPDDRVQVFLLEHCNGDLALQHEVERLRAACLASENFLSAPPIEIVTALLADVSAATPHTIGPYTILREIGRGGMGAVFLAERADVQKRVALKLVAGGMFAPARMQRFLLERRVLARLEHAHIARLLDAGITTEGTPWLAMEYVEGQRIDTWCRERALNEQQRLQLFEQVCNAVAYAHRNLVVHCDLKPSNILVTTDGEPRLVDFGIARLLANAEAEQLNVDARLLTPDYASPEQLRGEPITTASDVFQLGVLLHELMAGLSDPSTRSGPVDRDLEAIVRRATAPDPDQRYEGAQQLRDDVRRYLDAKPVLAGPATLLYRTRKFVARHRLGTATAGLVALLVFGSATLAAVQARRVSRERDRAEQATTLLADLFSSSDPTVVGSSSLTLQEVLDRATERMRGNAQLDPIVLARLLGIVATAYRNLGALQRGIELEIDAVSLLEHVLAQDHGTLLAAQRKLAVWQGEAGLVEEALARLRSVLDRERARGTRPRPALAHALHAAAYAYQLNHQRDTARALYDEALAIYRVVKPDSAINIEATLTNLAALADIRSDIDEAAAQYREAFERRLARLGARHPLTARSQVAMARALLRQDSTEQAQQIARAALETQRRTLPTPHADLADNLSLHAALLIQAGQFAGAENYQREALEMWRALYGDQRIATARATADLGSLLQRQGRLDEAAQLQRAAARNYAALSGARSLQTAISLANLAYTEFLRRRLDESERLYRQAVPVLDSIWMGRPAMAATLADFATVLAQRGSCQNAEPHARRSYELARTHEPENSVNVIRPQRLLAQCLVNLRRYADAEPLLLDAHRKLMAGWGPANQFTASAAQDLVILYERWERPRDAELYRRN